jgi:hypothetical protein
MDQVSIYKERNWLIIYFMRKKAQMLSQEHVELSQALC